MESVDLERQANHDVQALPPVTDRPPKDETPKSKDEPEQACFICLESHKYGQFAALVPCRRPSRRPQVVWRAQPWGRALEPMYIEPELSDEARESDPDIYRKLIDRCYHYRGWWKRWIPYYGIIDVREVNFYFSGIVKQDGRYPIHIVPLDLDEIRKECNIARARHPADGLDEGGYERCDTEYHSEECQNYMDQCDERCFRDAAMEAKRRLHNLRFLPDLMKCARDPTEANGLDTLDGMAQETCIYELKGHRAVTVPLLGQRFKESTPIRGLHFVLGWQTDRMSVDLPAHVSIISLGIALIWLCVVLWRGGGGDWGTAFAFAQVVAASIAILITVLRSS